MIIFWRKCRFRHIRRRKSSQNHLLTAENGSSRESRAIATFSFSSRPAARFSRRGLLRRARDSRRKRQKCYRFPSRANKR